MLLSGSDHQMAILAGLHEQNVDADQPMSELPSSTLPNSSKFSPVQRESCICRIGWKLVGLVLILIPGSSTGVSRSCRLAACFMMLAREKSVPHCFSTCHKAIVTP